MIFDKLMLSIYKKTLIKRQDSDGSVFLFDYSDFNGLKKEPFSFVSDTGARLDGGFYYYDNPKSNKLIVFDHGMGAGHRSYMREIETLCKAGYLVYSYDHEAIFSDTIGSSVICSVITFTINGLASTRKQRPMADATEICSNSVSDKAKGATEQGLPRC